MVRVTQTVASSMKVLAPLLENAPRPHSKIKAKVLAKPIKINAVDRGMSAKVKERVQKIVR